jgi:multidrug efflux pump subunit AcrB
MQNIYSQLARIFVRNRQLSWLLVLAIFAAGAFAFIAMPKQYNPEISLPAFRIVTIWPGATTAEMEQLVTNEIENKIYEISGVDETTAVTSAGQSVVTVLFQIGQELEASKTKLHEKMQSNLDLAPRGVQPPLIQQLNPENVPILTLAITSSIFDANGLREFAFDLREQLKTVEGATNLQVLGGRKRALSVQLDPERLTARGVAVSTVASAIQSANLHLPVGTLEGSAEDLLVEVDGNLTAESLALVAVAPGVRLSDVAEIADGFESVSNFVRLQNQLENPADAVYLSLAKRQGENGIAVAEAVRARLIELQSSFVPAGIELQIVRDDGRVAAESISGLTQNLATSIVIVALLLIVFLRWRAALVVALAIPLTFAGVLLIGYLAGETINRITLFALILSLGLLVDSATVVVENIYRHISRGSESCSDATVNAVGEVGSGLFMSTLTSVIVFLPMSFVTGMMGAYMGPIAFFVPVALLVSLVVAYTLSPFLAAHFFRSADAKSEQKTDRLSVWYRQLIQKILDSRRIQNRILAGVLIAVLVTFSFPALELIHFRMLPKADKEQFFIYLDAPAGTPLAATDALAQTATDFLLADRQVQSVQSFVGAAPVLDFNGLFKGADARSEPFQATLKVNLTHPDTRTEQSEQIVERLRPRLQQLFATEPDLRVKLVEDPPGPPVLATLLARVQGPATELRESLARDLLAEFRQVAGVVDLDSSLPTGRAERLITLDHERLAHSGVSAAEAIRTLQTALAGQVAGSAHLGTREKTDILLRFAPAARDDPADLQRIFLRNTAGELVALASVSQMQDASQSSALWHADRVPTTFVSAELAGRSVVYAVKDLIFRLLDYRSADLELTNWNLFGFEFRDLASGELYRVEWGGEFEMTLENFRDLGLAMLVAFLLVYAVLVAQFRSFLVPLLIMSSILLAFGGVMPGFAVLDFFGVYFTATSMIGLIALGGIVVNNAIILLEFLEQLRARGFTAKMAIIEATQTRLRPILLTSLTTILASLTIAGDPVWSGLAWAIVFGLTVSTVLTLLVFPVLYYRFAAE